MNKNNSRKFKYIARSKGLLVTGKKFIFYRRPFASKYRKIFLPELEKNYMELLVTSLDYTQERMTRIANNRRYKARRQCERNSIILKGGINYGC